MSSTAKRYERQGPLVEAEALGRAEAECLAVAVHACHRETPYDRLLMSGHDRHDARAEVRDRVRDALARWQGEEGNQS